jgi:hypothetical protein
LKDDFTNLFRGVIHEPQPHFESLIGGQHGDNKGRGGGRGSSSELWLRATWRANPNRKPEKMIFSNKGAVPQNPAQ